MAAPVPLPRSFLPGKKPGTLAPQEWSPAGEERLNTIELATAHETGQEMQCRPLQLLGGALLVSILLNARAPAKAYASTNDIFSESSSTVAYFVGAMAKLYGVDQNMALWIAGHESQFAWRGDVYNPAIEGDDGNSRGLWQISKIYHPEVSDKCAFDIVCSTEWSMEQLKKGKQNMWSTWRYRVAWFGYGK